MQVEILKHLSILVIAKYKGPAKNFVTGSDYFSATFYQTYF